MTMGFESFAAATEVDQKAFWGAILDVYDRYWHQLGFDGFSFHDGISRLPFVSFDTVECISSEDQSASDVASPNSKHYHHVTREGLPDKRYLDNVYYTTRTCRLRFLGRRVLERTVCVANEGDELWLVRGLNWLLATRDGTDLDTAFHHFNRLRQDHEIALAKKDDLEGRFAQVKGAADTALRLPEAVLDRDEAVRSKRQSILSEKEGARNSCTSGLATHHSHKQRTEWSSGAAAP
jgi:hypothetical protein